MRYATFDDLSRHISLEKLCEYLADEVPEGGCGFRDGKPAEAVRESALKAIDDAGTVIDSYILTRYPSLDTPPAMLTRVCAQLAVSYIVERSHIASREVCRWAQEIRKEQMELLRLAAEGKISVGAEPDTGTSGFKMQVSDVPVRLGRIFE